MSHVAEDEAWATHYPQEQAAAALSPPGTALIILGAGGDLSKKKTYPALLLLHKRGLLPERTKIWGVDRLDMTTASFRAKMAGQEYLRKASGRDDEVVKRFLEMCEYKQAQVDSTDDFSQLNTEICSWTPCTNRIFYLALPPAVFYAAVQTIKNVAMADAGDNGGRKPWTRVIVEKPFGHDLASSNALQEKLGQLLTEEQVYRIDHYLGKEMVQNLLVVRFANSMFEPMWNRHHIASVTVTFKEDITVEGRAGYFDRVGLMRDVMQNHLLQMVTLVAMEPPTNLSSEAVRDKKVDVLRAMKPLTLDDVILGQYEGYSFDPDVPSGSLTETYAQAVFKIENSRWRGVPFIVKCAKAVNERKCEIRVQFEESPLPYYRDVCASCGQVQCSDSCVARQGANRNEMVIRVQPDEAMYLKTNMKKVGEPGTVTAELDLSYHKRFPDAYVPEAYEKLIHDCILGQHANFVRNDELQESWRLFDGLLREMAEQQPVPHIYKRGTRGPKAADNVLEGLGVKRTHAYTGPAWKKMRAATSNERFNTMEDDVEGDAKTAREARLRKISSDSGSAQ